MTLVAAGAGFTPIDWAIVAAYLVGVVALGMWFSRRQKGTDDYFLGGRRTPAWAAAISVVATSVSAATFIGAPESAYKGNLTYLAPIITSFLAVLIVARWFIPRFYKLNAATVYELLEARLGAGARRSASAAFMFGRLLASGGRLFMAALPLSMIAFGDASTPHLVASIAIAAGAAVIYTVMGGLEAVIWTEVPQAALFVFAAVAAIVLLLLRIPTGPGEVWTALSATTLPDGTAKTTIFDTSLGLANDFSLWSALTGMLLFNVAVYGTDQDLAQRMLSCRNAVQGARSAIISNIMGLGVAVLFLVIGLLLYVFYRRPDLMGVAGAGAAPADDKTVFLHFILNEAPVGVRGLMLAGLFAAAMSSLASAMQAMASTLVCDFYRPRFPGGDERHYVRMSRAAVLLWGVLLSGFGVACIWLQALSGKGLISFAIGVMLYAYTGLLAVFLVAIFTRRGNGASAALALVVGAASVAVMQFAPALCKAMHLTWEPPAIGLGGMMLVGTVAAFVVCVAGAPGSAKQTRVS